MDNIGSLEDLVRYRISKAYMMLETAHLNYNNGDLSSAVNRAYYAVFNAISAVHVLNGNRYRKHKDAIANFNKCYVATGVFSRELGKLVSSLEHFRNDNKILPFQFFNLFINRCIF